jgi:DNA-binding LacI/PurR family transcriptional regulator
MPTDKNKSKKRITSYDVAREAGVSQSAVSRAFRPGLSISKKTRDKVKKAALKLGYKPNAIARMLITQRSGMVAVIISSMANFVYPELLTRLNEQLSAKGLRILLFTLDGAEELDEVLDRIWAYQVDGVIALAAHFEHPSIAQFEEHDIPVVLYNRQLPDHPVNAVCCDHEQGIGQLVQSLVNAGHKKYLVMSGPEYSDVANERRNIALRQLKQAGFDDVPVIFGNYSYESGKECFSRWMSEHPAPEAVICSNDMMAIGCIDEARKVFGILVPEQLSVVGFDGVFAASWGSYELTTIRQPVNQMAKAAVDILVERIENPQTAPEKRVLAGEFRKGNSARV